MNDEVGRWSRYANENFLAAKICREQGLIFASIFNSHQAVEKALKTVLVFHGLVVVKSHSIELPCQLVENAGVAVPLELHEIDPLDSTFMASRYPLGGIIEDAELTIEVAERAIVMAEAALNHARQTCVRQ